MAQPFVGQLLVVGFNFAPQGYATCSGQLMAISQNTTLFQLIGTTYGGDGQQTFGLPDLRGRIGMHQGVGVLGSSYIIGQQAGVEQVTLNVNQMAGHTHSISCSSNTQDSNDPSGAVMAVAADNRYGAAPPSAAMASAMMSSIGSNQPHENRQPFLVLNWVIALAGVFPTQN